MLAKLRKKSLSTNLFTVPVRNQKTKKTSNIKKNTKSRLKCDDIKQGTFVKIKFEQENSSKNNTYVAIYQTSLDSEMDVCVLYLNKVAKSGRLFKINTEEDEPYIKLSQILEVLPLPDRNLMMKECIIALTKK